MSWFIRGFACFMFLATGILVAPGCNTKAPQQGGDQKKMEDAKNTTTKKDDHPHEGPHDGALAEWGEEKYHAEFTVDREKKQATVYMLDGTAKKAAPIAVDSITLSLTNFKPSVQITLKADPDKGDPKGSSSRFVGTHEKLGEKMEFKGEISGKVGDTPYTGKFEEEHKGHKHEKKK